MPVQVDSLNWFQGWGGGGGLGLGFKRDVCSLGGFAGSLGLVPVLERWESGGGLGFCHLGLCRGALGAKGADVEG